eukprot:GDKJ01019707.1.p1 GENE.GDKJ01019707.1~~GDKJ01019707.1.p1  ORF type:complete len:575 (+),score=114.09 GDKJ01019707.1:78-1802(+)
MIKISVLIWFYLFMLSSCRILTNFTLKSSFDYDLIVVGGGSAGIQFTKEFKDTDTNILLIDHVFENHRKIRWGFGGTCVNVGCVPKKLLHHAAKLNYERMTSFDVFGLVSGSVPSINWQKLIQTIQNKVKELNFKYKKSVKRMSNVEISTSPAFILDDNTIRLDSKIVTTRFLIIATGSTPKIPSYFPLSQRLLTSDDLFSFRGDLGRLLVVGGGFIGVEVASALSALSTSASRMKEEASSAPESSSSRGRDIDVCWVVSGDLLANASVDDRARTVFEGLLRRAAGRGGGMTCPFPVRRVVQKIEERGEQMWVQSDEGDATFDHVLLAVGRTGNTGRLGPFVQPFLRRDDYLPVEDFASFRVRDRVFAIGDVVDGLPQYTTIARWSARVAAQTVMRELGLRGALSEDEEREKKDAIVRVREGIFSRAVFASPFELGMIGLSQHRAEVLFGVDRTSVVEKGFETLEDGCVSVASDEQWDGESSSLVKAVVVDGRFIVGLHIVDKGAAEIVSAVEAFYILALREVKSAEGEMLKVGVPVETLKETRHRAGGVHPTMAEVLSFLWEEDETLCGGGSC